MPPAGESDQLIAENCSRQAGASIISHVHRPLLPGLHLIFLFD
jgi:hypothetical protein